MKWLNWIIFIVLILDLALNLFLGLALGYTFYHLEQFSFMNYMYYINIITILIFLYIIRKNKWNPVIISLYVFNSVVLFIVEHNFGFSDKSVFTIKDLFEWHVFHYVFILLFIKSIFNKIRFKYNN